MATIHEQEETHASQILAQLTTLDTTHKALLNSIRERSLAPVAPVSGDPEDPCTFAGVSMSPSAWKLVEDIERLVGEVDHAFRSAREALAGASGQALDHLASGVAAHRLTPARIEAAVGNLNASITSLTVYLATKSVTFQWSLLPLK